VKIVIDTNVIISGIYFGGIPKKLLETVLNNTYQIIISENIIYEYFDVIHRMSKKRMSPDAAATQVLNKLISNAKIIEPGDIKTPSCEDPDDIKFLQAAIVSNAEFLISGDKHLLDVGKYKGGIVLKPKEFLLSI